MKVVGQFPRVVREIENQWITLADGSVVKLDPKILEPVAEAAGDIQFDKHGHAEVSTLELGNLSRLLSEVPTAKVAKEVKKLMQSMTGQKAGRAPRKAKALTAKLREYQRSGYAWLWFGYAVLSVITLGWAVPWMTAELQRYEIEKARFGVENFSYEGSGSELFWRWFPCAALWSLGIAIAINVMPEIRLLVGDALYPGLQPLDRYQQTGGFMQYLLRIMPVYGFPFSCCQLHTVLVFFQLYQPLPQRGLQFEGAIHATTLPAHTQIVDIFFHIHCHPSTYGPLVQGFQS